MHLTILLLTTNILGLSGGFHQKMGEKVLTIKCSFGQHFDFMFLPCQWFVIVMLLCSFFLRSRKRKESEPRTKCLLNNADITPHHPTDPVEMRRINFQTPGREAHSQY